MLAAKEVTAVTHHGLIRERSYGGYPPWIDKRDSFQHPRRILGNAFLKRTLKTKNVPLGHVFYVLKYGGAYRDRTGHLYAASVALYQMS